MKVIIPSTMNAKTRDPFILKHNGLYYHCFSDDGKTVSVSCFKNIDDISTAESKKVFIPNNKMYSCEIWAPELHIINDKCYIYVACDDGNNYNHRMYVLENGSNDPMKEYSMLGKISDSTDKWAIDGNVITFNEELYYFWSGWEGNRNVRQNIYIAKLKDPCTLSSERVMISTPTYEWEKIGCTPEDVEGKPYINEGPFAFVYNNELYLAYSASGSWDKGYCISFLKLIGNDPLLKENWYKYDKPTLSSNDLVVGAGHPSIIDEDDKKIIFFHGWKKECEKIAWNTVSTWMGELELVDGRFLIK